MEANVLLARLVGEYLHLYTKCIFVHLDFVMDTQRLIELGKEMSLEGEDLRAFVRQEQEAAREERASVRQEAREVEEAAAKQRHEEAAAKQRHEEAAAKHQHEKEMLTLQLEADRLRVQEAREASISHAQLDSSRSTRIGGRSPKLPSFCDGKDDMAPISNVLRDTLRMKDGIPNVLELTSDLSDRVRPLRCILDSPPPMRETTRR